VNFVATAIAALKMPVRVFMLRHGCWVFVLAGCAIGSSPNQQGQQDAAHDGNSVTVKDAGLGDASSQPHDAHLLDAFVPQDAALVPEGGFCSKNHECATSCCYIALCVAGTPVGDTLCFPN